MSLLLNRSVDAVQYDVASFLNLRRACLFEFLIYRHNCGFYDFPQLSLLRFHPELFLPGLHCNGLFLEADFFEQCLPNHISLVLLNLLITIHLMDPLLCEIQLNFLTVKHPIELTTSNATRALRFRLERRLENLQLVLRHFLFLNSSE